MPIFSSLHLTVSIFGLVYGVFLCVYTFYTLFNVYNLVRYGYSNFSLYLLMTFFVGGGIILVAASLFQLMTYDWSFPIEISGMGRSYNKDLFPGL